MRVLLYGGCHAAAIKRIFERHALGEHRFDTLINFQLIRTNTPFPYERLGEYDLVMFSPVLNQGAWNTVFLEQACAKAGVRAVKFPWLQWGGYWPAPKKRAWGRYAEWGIPRVRELAGQWQDFEAFYAALFRADSFAPALGEWVETTTRILRHKEDEGRVDIRITDFVADSFAERQLFLTPDHPSTELYKFLIRALADAAGLSVDPGFYASALQVQEGVRTPIPPGAAEALGLRFGSAEWSHHDFLPATAFSLRDWALTYHPSGRVFLGVARANTRLRPGGEERTDETMLSFRKGTRLLVRAAADGNVGARRPCRVLGPGQNGCWSFFAPHWEFFAPES